MKINVDKPTPIFCDNKSAIHISENLEDGIINLEFIETKRQLANIFTKSVGENEMSYALVNLGIKDIYSPT